MLFVGDLLQLQPVSGNPVFERIATKSLLFKLGCATSVNIWKESLIHDELTINERQKKDEEFSLMLDCVRHGCPTEETLCTLKQRVIEVLVSDKFRELQQLGQTPVCLFPTRKFCDDFNAKMLTFIIIIIIIIDRSIYAGSMKASSALQRIQNRTEIT